MADAHANFAVSQVATAPSPATSGTSLVVTAAQGVRFPTPPFNATISPTGVQPTPLNAEIVRVTAISTDTFTITRTQEGTSARTIVAGDQIVAAITAKTLTDVESGGSLVLLSTTTLASPGTFDVSGISQAYNDLILVLIARGTDAGVTDNVYVRFNNDSGANYYGVQNTGNNGGVASNPTSSAAGCRPNPIPAAGATANSFSSMEMTITGYASTVWIKAMRYEVYALSALTANPGQWGGSGGYAWNNTAAITRIQVLGLNTANLATGSQLRIYGLL